MIYATIKNDDLIATVPNVEIVLRRSLPMIVTSFVGERTFGNLNLLRASFAAVCYKNDCHEHRIR